MGQKVNPNGFRVGVIKDWNTRWYASKKDFADFLVEDRKIRDFVKKKYYQASISRIEIDRAAGKITVSIFTAAFSSARAARASMPSRKTSKRRLAKT